jgi:hypothetical protein
MVSFRWARSFTFAAAVVLLASIVPINAASADQPAPFDQWPACSAPSDQFCIESATIGGVDLMSPDGVTSGGSPLAVRVSLLDDHSVNWAVQWSDSGTYSIPEEFTGSTISLVLRTGALVPRFTSAIADRFYLTTAGDDASGYTLTIEGTPSTINWLVDTSAGNCFVGSCGDETTQADTAQNTFSGNTQDMAFWDPADVARFSGMYVATNAQYRPTVVLYGSYPAPNWSLQLGNPHLTGDGSPADGSFTAFVPGGYFTSAGLDAADAVATGFSITRTDEGIDSSVDGAASFVDGGAYLRIPSLGYSSPTITVGALDGGAPGAFAPDPPSLTDASAAPGAVAVDFTAPHFDGGSPITSYVASCTQSETTQSATVAAGAALHATVGGLSPGDDAECQVVAVNDHGESLASNHAHVVPAPLTEPDAPTIGLASAGLASATVRWNAPANNGGSSITGYVVSCQQTGLSTSATTVGTARSAVLHGLLTGAVATCRVTAHNTLGSSAASAAAHVTPTGPARPTAPTHASATVSRKTLRLTWDAPAVSGSSLVSGYRVTVCAVGSSCAGRNVLRTAIVTGETARASVAGLAKGHYDVAVFALNHSGASAPARVAFRLR